MVLRWTLYQTSGVSSGLLLSKPHHYSPNPISHHAWHSFLFIQETKTNFYRDKRKQKKETATCLQRENDGEGGGGQGLGGCCGGRVFSPNGPPEILLEGTSLRNVLELEDDPDRDREFPDVSSCWNVPTLGDGGMNPLLLLLLPLPSRCSGGTGLWDPPSEVMDRCDDMDADRLACRDS